MGSCYSCKSGQQHSHSYTTLTMANTDQKTTTTTATTTDNSKRISPYARGSTTSFGFINKRRIPPSLKSQSQDRTTEMVSNYESKISNINANNQPTSKISPKHVINNRIQSQIPRFGHKSMSTSSLESSEDVHSSNSSLTDPNSNTVVVVHNHRHQQRGTGINKSKQIETTNKKSQENSRENSPKPRNFKSGLKPPTVVSGLPVPKTQVINKISDITSRKKNGTKLMVAPLAQFDEIEAMQISSDTLPDEDIGNADLDSGLGISDNSDKNHKQEGDNETLGEVSELASDNGSIKEKSPEKKMVSPQKMASPKKMVSPKKLAVKGKPKPSKEICRILSVAKDASQYKTGGYQFVVPLRKSGDLSKTIASKFNEEDDFGDDVVIGPPITKEKIEFVNTVKKIVPNIEKKCKKVDEVQDKMAAAKEKSAKVEKPMDTSTTSVESSTSLPGSTDLGAISPPSERDTFLIDDEICDQPDLIACENNDLQKFLRSTEEYFGRDADIFPEDGGNEGMAVFRCASLDTLSSSSSINSNDLMLDFDHGDDNTLTESTNRRLSCADDGETNSQETTTMKPQSRHRSKSLKIQQHSDSSFEVIDEWTNLVESHVSDGTTNWPKSRRVRTISSPEANSSSTETRILRPPRQMIAADLDDGGVTIDPSSFRSMSQDVTNLKTMLLKLKRVIQESETINPFETHNIWKNGLFHNLALSDPPRGCNIKEECNALRNEEVTQENSDLRRQVVFLQQQMDEKDKTIHLLQQQMTKYTNCNTAPPTKSESCNAATQTDKPRLSLTSMSQNHDASPFGTTVSSKNNDVSGNSSSKIKQRSSQQQTNDITRSLNSLTPASLNPNERIHIEDNPPLSPLDRSASEGELAANFDHLSNNIDSDKSTSKVDKNVVNKTTRPSRLFTRIPSIRRSSSGGGNHGNQVPVSTKTIPKSKTTKSNLKMSLPPSSGNSKRSC